MNRNLKQKQHKQSLLLDTSVQIDKFNPGSIDAALRKLSANYDLYTSYFVKYEFKTGFIRSLIAFYSRVNIDGPIKATAKWGKSFHPRDLKYKAIMDCIIAQCDKTIYIGDKKKYLAQIEMVIFHLMNNFMTELTGIVGDFSDDEVIDYEILTSSDFAEFEKKINDRKCIPQAGFWEKHKIELVLLIKDKTVQTSKDFESVNKYLREISEDFKKSDKYFHNKGVGDVIIAIDSPKTHKLVSLDSAFQTYCKVLKKELITLSSSYFAH
ncbi:MAG: hypothetical protein AAB512_02450 [Patescibacteria group bacterium]